MPSKRTLMEKLSVLGYWSFLPRYRGTWESDGEFLKESPTQDVLYLLDALPQVFTDIWNKTEYKFKPSEVILIGSSFGGAVALDASRDKRIKKIIAFSPVVDWTVFPESDLKTELEYLKEGFGNVYRFKDTGYKKLCAGKYCNPVNTENELKGKRICVVQAKDDKAVPWRETVGFARRVGADIILERRGGHYSVSEFLNPKFYRKLVNFLRGN